jgi:hypothetical protein
MPERLISARATEPQPPKIRYLGAMRESRDCPSVHASTPLQPASVYRPIRGYISERNHLAHVRWTDRLVGACGHANARGHAAQRGGRKLRRGPRPRVLKPARRGVYTNQRNFGAASFAVFRPKDTRKSHRISSNSPARSCKPRRVNSRARRMSGLPAAWISSCQTAGRSSHRGRTCRQRRSAVRSISDIEKAPITSATEGCTPKRQASRLPARTAATRWSQPVSVTLSPPTPCRRNWSAACCRRCS